jgi:hypothetical protein
VASQFIERLRGKIPYIRRLHRKIDDLHHRLAGVEHSPVIPEPVGYQPERLTSEFRAFLRLLRPHDVLGHNKQRFGIGHDGGYVMLDDFAAVQYALSLGIGREVSWDVAMAARDVRIMQYDDSVDASPQANERFIFHRRRVVAEIETPQDITLAMIMADKALAADGDIVAKIDIENAEWNVLARTETSIMTRIRQFAIEFHGLRNFADEHWRATAVAALQNIAASTFMVTIGVRSRSSVACHFPTPSRRRSCAAPTIALSPLKNSFLPRSIVRAIRKSRISFLAA